MMPAHRWPCRADALPPLRRRLKSRTHQQSSMRTATALPILVLLAMFGLAIAAEPAHVLALRELLARTAPERNRYGGGAAAIDWRTGEVRAV